MKTVLVLLFISLAQATLGQTVIVKSGDHSGFTRLVLELPQVTDWKMGRTADGYELRLPTLDIRYNLTRVFDNIQRNRLAAVWVDPVSGGLRIGVACACHAMPFEFRPGIIVIDLRDGPPPKGSSFELALNGATAPDLAARPSRRPMPRPGQSSGPNLAGGQGPNPSAENLTKADRPEMPTRADYDWIAASAPTKVAKQSPLIPPVATIQVKQSDIGPLKDALLRQLGKGAVLGIVQMAQPDLAARNTGDVPPIGPRANIRMGDAPGFGVTTKRGPENLMIKDGVDCVSDDQVNIEEWGNDLPVSVQIADARANLIGEFDKPDVEAVINSAKLLIHIGFGAEARQLLAQMPVENADIALLASLAKLVDGGSDASGPFSGMLTCDSAAALWAALAQPRILPYDQPQTSAVLRTFSALPKYLRQTLGPDLAARFLDAGDLATAHAIQNAVVRGLNTPSPDIAVMQAGIELAAGNSAAAAAHLEPVLAEAGPATASALIALVDARLAADEQVPEETATALGAFVRELAGSDLDPALRRAHILALGSVGDFDQAFALLPTMPSDGPSAAPDLWALLARSGSDGAILEHAVLEASASLPDIDREGRNQIAEKLIKLGLADPALNWIGGVTKDSAEEDRLLFAAAQMVIGDAELALQSLDGLPGNLADDLRAKAFLALERPADAGAVWADTDNKEAELRAQSWAQNWDKLAEGDASVWQSAADLTMPRVIDAMPGPLALGTFLVADSVDARARLAALLAGVPGPTPNE